MSHRQWLPLIGVILCVFVFNMSEFLPISLLTDIATDLDVSESKAGLIISAYAWTVAILSLPIMLLLRRISYRGMLLMCVGVFAVFQTLCGMSTGYNMLLLSRLGVAVSHSVFWSIASPIAVRVVSQEYQKLAVGAVAAGTSVAMIVGLPAGRIIGLAFGWRSAFISVAAISVIALVYLTIVFPRVENPGTFTLKRVPDLFSDRILLSIYVLTAVYVTGYFTAYSYVEPFLDQVAGLTANAVTVGLTLFGFAGIIGSAVFARVYDRGRYVFILLTISGAAFSVLMLRPFSSVSFLVLAVCGVWGFCATALYVALQTEILRTAPSDASAVATALFSGIFNVGIAMGSIVGGVVTDSFSVGDVGYAGGAMIAVGILIAVFALFRYMRRAETFSDTNRSSLLWSPSWNSYIVEQLFICSSEKS